MQGDDFTDDVMGVLDDAESGDTFAVRIEPQADSANTHTKQARITTVYDRERMSDDFPSIMKLKLRRDPSAEYLTENPVHETDDGAVIHRLGPSDMTIHAISKNTDVDYSSDRQLLTTCEECGNTGVLPVEEDDLEYKTILADSDGEWITTCCGAGWVAELSEPNPDLEAPAAD